MIEFRSTIDMLRERYPQGLHFVVGDTHGEWETLRALMKSIRFDPEHDHVYFVGDYNSGGSVRLLMDYISLHFREDWAEPGFHLIRGNHERELCPFYPLANLPDIVVLRMEQLDYYIAHAGMIGSVFSAIHRDISDAPVGSVHAYSLEDSTVAFDAPFRQIVWSRRGLYSRRSQNRAWVSEDVLRESRSCIIHGHTPYNFLLRLGYGEVSHFFKRQHAWFSEDLQSFNIDSNIKGRYECDENFRGLSCLSLELVEEIARDNGGLTVEGVAAREECLFCQNFLYTGSSGAYEGDVARVLNSSPAMKKICADEHGEPYIK